MNEDSRPPTAEIAAIFPAAIKIEARELRPGDLLFDAYGGTHEIQELRRKRGWVDSVRVDGFEDRFHQYDTITIIRPQDQEV